MIFELILSLFLIYLVLILAFIYGNMRLSVCPKRQIKKDPEISVIIPIRNEETCLNALYKDLKRQTYPADLVEVIFVDDHSDDGSRQILENLIQDDPNYRLLSCEIEFGKKAALKKGIKEARNQLLITTDADVHFGSRWLESMINCYCREETKLLAGPVKMHAKGGFRNCLMELEFASLIASTSGSIGIHQAIMCNGANLMFSKDLFNALQIPSSQESQASGDDVFFLHAVKKHNFPKRAISFANHAEALVTVKPPAGTMDFFHQRLRWAAKGKLYQDRFTIFCGAVVLLTNFALLLLFLLCLFLWSFKWFLLIFIFKWGVDYLLIKSLPNWLRPEKIFFLSLILALVYPFYVLSVALLSLLIQPNWKKRKI